MGLSVVHRRNLFQNRLRARGAIVTACSYRCLDRNSNNCKPKQQRRSRCCIQLVGISNDPSGFGAGDPNLYRIVGNKVTTHRDPTGLEEEGFYDSETINRMLENHKPENSPPWSLTNIGRFLFGWTGIGEAISFDIEGNAGRLDNLDTLGHSKAMGNFQCSEGTQAGMMGLASYPIIVATITTAGPEDLVTGPAAKWLAAHGLRIVREAGEWVLKRGDTVVARGSGGVANAVADAIRVGVPDSLTIPSRQFGQKMAQRARELGLDPADPRVRHQIMSRIQRIFDNADEVRCGLFRGQAPNGTEGSVLFYLRGNDVVVTTPDGTFVTLLVDGINNQRVINGVRLR